MSRSNPTLQNPCKKFIDFKADTGQFYYYDKEQEKKIEVPMPIHFVVLDELSTITGFSKKHDAGIYSNEVGRITDEVLHVKVHKGGEVVSGLYKEIKDNITAIGGKYTKSVYAMMDDELVNFQFKGAAFSAWMDKKFSSDSYTVAVTGTRMETNGATKYNVPIFEAAVLTPEMNNAACQMDRMLQVYLKEYKAQQGEKEIAKVEVDLTIPEKVSPQLSDKGFVKESRGQKQPAVISDVKELDDLPWDNNVQRDAKF